jgi:hypothetical protein
VNRALVRTTLGAVAGVLAVLLLASPAWAHTEIEIDHPQGGATDVTMRVTSEAENSSAGIASVQMQLPAGISPAQVTLVSGPAGWTLTRTSDGFTVSGAPLTVKTDAKFTVKLAQLPPAGGVLVFKTLVTYTDGKVDRWIEEPSAGNPSPKDPAPTVSVRPGARPPSTSPSSAAPSAPASAAPDTPVSSPVAAGSGGGGTTLWWIVGGVVVLVALATVVQVLRRRR